MSTLSIERHGLRAALRCLVIVALASTAFGPAVAQVELSDQPVLSITAVPGNLALPLSVEYPTAVSVANIADYTTTRDFLGYFDPAKCYAYNYDGNEANRYFYPTATTTTRSCTGAWSGSFLNWAAMQTIDPFRKVLTGGHRSTDTTTVTILEKARASGQGGTGNFPNRTLSGIGPVGQATPFGWSNFRMRIEGLNTQMRFTGTGNVDDAATAYNPAAAIDPAVTYAVSIRVRVCDPAAPGGVESNCVRYDSNYKPEGLLQEYSDRIRYSAFGYLNDSNILRDGGVLRARQKFVGPMEPRPGLPAITNAVREWDASTGVFIVNPDTADATASGVTNSGVINYLNKFGQSGSYKTYDPVGELYYAAVRYFKALQNGTLLGNVPEWSTVTAGNESQRDGFPVITTWDDPIQYACQRNYILGIGDVNSHADKNVPGPTSSADEPTKPAAVAADTTVDAVAQTNLIGTKQGYAFNAGDSTNWGGCCSNNSTLMAGIAYDAHVRDIRPDNAAIPRSIGMQTITTYWMDVLEFQTYKNDNQFYLATKYGGFRVPAGYDPTSTAALPLSTWYTASRNRRSPSNQQLPDNYFTATAPEEIEAGLREAFASIARELSAVTTSFSLSSPQVTSATSGNASYSAQYDASSWTGTVVGNQLDFNALTGAVTSTERWNTNTTLEAQLAGTGWDDGRRVVTFNGTGGVPFRSTSPGITAAQLGQLDTPYGAGVDGPQYLNYLRGDRANEVGAPGTPLGYRPRLRLLGDIDGSKVTVVGAPASRYSDATNPGYGAFSTDNATRAPIAYVGANDGMLHAFNGALTGTGAGSEVFAYVPSVLFNGPTAPATDGLVSRGNPNFVHRSLVNARAQAFDVDINRVGGPINASATPDWRTILIGGLGKGGRRYYAINVTNPLGGTQDESTIAGLVRWEFPSTSNATHATAINRMGFTYGEPLVTKTVKWGWVVILPSGYNNASGGSFIFFLNPWTGDLLETVTVGTAGEPSEGLAHIQGFRRDFSNNTAESIYAGDLNGNIWRLDVRGSGAYPAPVNIARLTAPGTGARQPVTTRLLVEVDPLSGRRFVLVGTGRLLDDSDISSTAAQSFYAIVDGTGAAFSESGTLPSGVNYPITRANLVANNNASLSGSGVTLATNQVGWYIDLGGGTADVAAPRVVLDPTTAFRRVAFAALLPSGDACTPSGTSRIYAVDFGSGASVFTSDRPYIDTTSAVIDLRFVSIDGQRSRLYVGGAGGTSSTGGLFGPSSPRCTGNVCEGETEELGASPLRRLNWREIPAPQ